MRQVMVGETAYTEAELYDSVMDGYCVHCHEQHDHQVEPDARNYTCSHCGSKAVFSVLELVLNDHELTGGQGTLPYEGPPSLDLTLLTAEGCRARAEELLRWDPGASSGFSLVQLRAIICPQKGQEHHSGRSYEDLSELYEAIGRILERGSHLTSPPYLR